MEQHGFPHLWSLTSKTELQEPPCGLVKMHNWLVHWANWEAPSSLDYEQVYLKFFICQNAITV